MTTKILVRKMYPQYKERSLSLEVPKVGRTDSMRGGGKIQGGGGVDGDEAKGNSSGV